MAHDQKNPETKQMSKFWMSVDQAENPEEFAKSIPGEFTSSPIRDGADLSGFDRRDFMKIMGAGALMASMAGCARRPVQKIVPYVVNPEEIIPGLPNFYASTDPVTGYGLILKTREGRPIKVDGNADHPMNRGALSASGQAVVHDLYDPDRLRAPMIDGAEVSWENFDAAVSKLLSASRGGTWLLSGTVMSPTLRSAIEKSKIKHVMVDSLSMDDVLDGQAQSYGSRVFPRYRFDQADYILSLDADFLGTWGSSVEYTHQYTSKRKLDGGKISMNKLVAFESVMRLTGQNADKRYTVHPNDMLLVALSIAHEVARLTGRSAGDLSSFGAEAMAQRTGVSAETTQEIAKDLVKFRGRGLVVAAGEGPQGAALQNVVNFLNSTLENEGVSVDGSLAPSNQYQGSYAELDRFLNAARTGGVKTLIVQGLNPAYLFADSMGVKETLKKIPNLIYVGSYKDETAALAKYVAAESHPFEAWGDVSPQKDIYGVQQPTIRPLWKTKSLLEMLVDWSPATTGSKIAEDAYEALTNTWKPIHARFGGSKGFQDWWDDTLMSGFVGGVSRGDAPARTYRMDALHSAVAAARSAGQKGVDGEFTLVITHSMAMGDGSQSNNALLQVLPDPVSKLTWGNYLAVAPSTAKRMGWNDGDIVKMENAAANVELTVYRQPGMHPGVVASHGGYGRQFNGRLGNNVGVSLANFTASATMGVLPSRKVVGVRISKTGKSELLPCTQGHQTLEGREIVFDTSLEEYRKDPKSGIVHEGEPTTIWSGYKYPGYRWGMTIDMNACTGCSACVIACSVENNVPAVAKDQVQNNREMQWIRLDRYYSGDPENPDTVTQVMLCQHCENAPCETVCPVLATVHSDEGLNQMVYNRCVGTKYCSNNCPYKVRRFNWFENNAPMNAPMEHPLPLMKNPEVTLRSRGVMEKCTFCIQRIEHGKHKAKFENRRVKDDDIRTACQDACPADAIVFGDLNNPESRVAQLSKHPRGYKSLEELNARPSVTYLTKVRNRPAETRAEPNGESQGAHEQGKA
jgi:molybdopterin-containing oxidoreductase family iron-sulfur binding subunit